MADPARVEKWAGGYPQQLVDWYNNGADGAINWGEDGDFEACVAIAGKYIDNPEGFCNERHQDATGAAPGHASGEEAEKARAEHMASLIEQQLAPAIDRLIAASRTPDPLTELVKVLATKAGEPAQQIHVHVPQPAVDGLTQPPIYVTVEPPSVTVESPAVTVEAPNVTVQPPEVHVAAPSVTVEAPDVQVDVAAPNVQVEAPTVNVAAPDVTVEAPAVTVEAAQVSPPDVHVHVPEPSGKTTAYRRSDGTVVVERQ